MAEVFVRFMQQNMLAVAIFVVGVILICATIIFSMFSNQSQAVAINQVSPVPVHIFLPTPTSLPHIVIDVEGAVQKPGVYTLPGDSRVQDAISAAQGFAKDADEQKIASSLNLAAKLSDATKIYIPSVHDTTQAVVLGTSTDGSGQASGGLININTASESDLDSLPGIGAVTAQKIIDGRPYSDISDLQTKKIVKSNVYAEIKDKISSQ